MQQNTTVSAIVSQILESGLQSLRRQERAQQPYEQLRAALSGMTEEQEQLIDGVRLLPGSAE